VHTPALPTLRGQALQQFAQALGDLVELGHTRVGEGHVEAATTPPALGLGIGVLLAFRQPSLALCLSGGRLVRGRLLFLALDVRGRRLFLALLVPSRIIGCEDLRSLKKTLNSAFVATMFGHTHRYCSNKHTHPIVQGLVFVDMKIKNLKSQCPHCGHG
jgi:hypothetical protein